MEVYTLDPLLRRTEVFDKFESLIWTERWRDIGDFEIDFLSSLETRSNFATGTLLAMNESHRVMEVTDTEDTTDEEGRSILNVKGRSIEKILEDRVAMESLMTPLWTIIDKPGDVARTMFDHICRTGALSLDDKIPFLLAGMPTSIGPADTIPETLTSIKWEQSPDSLYNAIKAICDTYDLGFRLLRKYDESKLYFDIYSGRDRTTRQFVDQPVIFAPSFDNLENTTEFSSIDKSKNVAYVVAQVTIDDVTTPFYEIVYGENVDPDIDGFERRVLVVNASVNSDEADIEGVMIQAGTEELQKARAQSLFDGEINENSSFRYGIDYNLGDLTEMRNKDGIITYKRVTEQIFVSDAEGERSYPTLAMDLYANANTWLSYKNKSTVWSDFTVEHWDDM